MKPTEPEDRNDYGAGAGRAYDDHVRRFVAAGRVAQAAEQARRSIEGPDGPALHEAEVESARTGTLPGDPAWMGHVRELAHHAIDLMLSAVVRADDWVRARTPRASYQGDGRPQQRR